LSIENVVVESKGLRVISKDPGQSLPTSVQKSYFLLGTKERDVLNQALSKYRPGQSEPILIGGEKLLKPALKLMSFFRLHPGLRSIFGIVP
jgi:hypothetical protein